MTFSTFSQKNSWTLGLYVGVQGQISTSVKQDYIRAFYMNGVEEIIDRWNPPTIKLMHTFSKTPPAELTVKYNIGNYFSIATGIGYRGYYMTVQDNPYYRYTSRRDYLQVPIILQYDIPLKKKGFFFFIQGGIALDFEVGYRGWGYHSGEYYDDVSHKQLSCENLEETFFGEEGFNQLLYGGFGFSYKFNSGIGISLLGRYNIGSVYINNYSYRTVLKEVGTDIVEKEIKEHLYCKAESWNALLGVTYTFKQKKKDIFVY